MTNTLFIFGLGLLCALNLGWGFRTLPREGWQILAAIPRRPQEGGRWQGTNLTWYGLLTANAYLTAAAISLILLGALRVPFGPAAALVALLLALGMPASRWVAALVEKKAHTFTVGGAVFVVLLAAPWAALVVNRLPWRQPNPLPVMPVLAAVAIAYTFGEGLGRLACISFGCCYGKPLSDCAPRLQRLFARFSFTFRGATRKIAYAGGLEGEKVLPVQALTAVLLVAAGLAGTALFLVGRCGTAFFLTVLATQGWRVFSETLRADYRGERRFSAYQVMGLLAIPYALCLSMFFAQGATLRPDVLAGLNQLWHPAPLLLLQALWLVVLVRTGLSSVTGSTLSFHVHDDRI